MRIVICLLFCSSLLAQTLREDVTTLASPAFEGRGSKEARAKTREYLVSRFAKAGLSAVGDSYEHPFIWLAHRGVNVVGMCPGEGALAKRHVIVSAHYDHLGAREGEVFPGAADNASGIATMLRIAAGASKWKGPRRTVLFVAFDLEEKGLLGSFAYAAKPPVPLETCDFFVTIDILGRKGLGLIDRYLFVQGWEWTPDVVDLVTPAVKAGGLTAGYFWTDVTGDRSDFVAFKKKRVPHLFFSTGENADYHRTTDLAANMDWGLLERQAGVVEAICRGLASRTQLWPCRKEPVRDVLEFVSLQQLAKALGALESSRITKEMKQQFAMLGFFAKGVVKKGTVSEEDREGLLRAARQLQRGLR